MKQKNSSSDDDTVLKADNFEWLFGKGKDLLDEEFDIAIAEQSKPDPKMWD